MNNDWKFIAIISSAVVGIYGWFLKHAANTKRHPSKDDIVFKDVCDERSKRLEDCIEGAIASANQRYVELKTDTEKRHNELKNDMQHGFNRIAQEIKNSRRQDG